MHEFEQNDQETEQVFTQNNFVATRVGAFFNFLWTVSKLILKEIHEFENVFIGTTNIYTIICQLLVFTMCEIAIIGPPVLKKNGEEKVIMGLTTLLACNVFGYFLMKMRGIFENSWSFRIPHTFNARLYMTWGTKLILEWAKATAIILYVQDKGVNFDVHPYFTPITFIYYLTTEKIAVDLLIILFEKLNLERMESMEHFYVPILLNIYAIFCATILGIWLSFTPFRAYALFSTYFTVYLRCKYTYYKYVKSMAIERETYASFRLAEETDLKRWNDICAVCLNPMSTAKITPCNHLFHLRCLKLCLRNSFRCPLCKYEFSALANENEPES